MFRGTEPPPRRLYCQLLVLWIAPDGVVMPHVCVFVVANSSGPTSRGCNAVSAALLRVVVLMRRVFVFVGVKSTAPTLRGNSDIVCTSDKESTRHEHTAPADLNCEIDDVNIDSTVSGGKVATLSTCSRYSGPSDNE